MNDVLRERMLRKLETLSDEKGYQVLDFIEFLESKYATRRESSPGIFQRFAETVEDTLRGGRVSAATIGETMSYLSKAMGVLSGAVAAGKSVASDVVSAATRPASGTGRIPAEDGSSGASPPPAAPHPPTAATQPRPPEAPPATSVPPASPPPAPSAPLTGDTQ
jgi:hypothetical protein